MKVKTRLLCAFVSFTLISAALMSGCGGSSKKTKLYFDGGGGSGNYTTTSKYDTLETLAKEWNRNNDEFEWLSINLRSTETEARSRAC